MTKNENFEQLQLHSGINPIFSERYPESFPLHWHQYVEIMALPYDAQITETPIIHIHNNRYELKPGDIVFAWSGELHEIINNSDQQMIALQFPSNMISELQEFVPYLNTFRTFHIINGASQNELAHNIQSFLKRMLELKKSNPLFSDLEIRICLYELFIHLGTYIHTQDNIYTKNTTSYPRQTLNKMNQACSYIIENCEQNLSLDEVSLHFGFSSFYFSRIFKVATGMNYTEYLSLQRVKRAQTYLAESDLNMTEIAFLSGFKSIASFNRTFKHFRGCAPRDYRKYHTNE